MKSGFVITSVFLGFIMAAAQFAFAHTPFCTCYENGDGSVTCEGGFSDGSTSAGNMMIVKDGNGKILVKGRMDEDGEFSFKKPEGNYSVKMDGGDMHVVTIDSEDIIE